ncbi:YokU family protein [Bacillus sp. V3-13]|uniref:YokU family protein n=1 Tax=Bacillus sp. V3-13 TaxID=2053728 RepID=UPI000C780336|nr:YokU family protein [Bacillus sp. V3-13]PLR77268.1 YokU family protein [Bacillus sp. V3-13]
MERSCSWCSSAHIETGQETVYWELPDGTRAIEITDVPSTVCHDCHIVYQTDEIVKTIEDQLFIVNTKSIGKTISFEGLINLPKLLKKNYFDFS